MTVGSGGGDGVAALDSGEIAVRQDWACCLAGGGSMRCVGVAWELDDASAQERTG